MPVGSPTPVESGLLKSAAAVSSIVSVPKVANLRAGLLTTGHPSRYPQPLRRRKWWPLGRIRERTRRSSAELRSVPSQTWPSPALWWTLRCGIFWLRPAVLQRFCKPRFMLANMCAITFTHSFLTNGCINVVLPTLERRFQLRSFESAMIISTYNVANCIAIAPIAFMGTSRNKPVFIGVGVLTVGVGALLFSSVHFIAPSYQWGSELQDLCPAGQLPDDLCLSGDVRNYRFLLMLAHALHGIGSTPFYTLGVSYLDENVPTRMVSTYLGKSSVLLNGT
ncbi:solute carrier organic anion transporter family member 4A1 [Rhipicephalus sanguineus]|uniref:solute carrier organic anion transporter family member 4A1 n=1 Tax=Rhipicephalus sanguineus TaxID=34632 RepID=UPI0020C3C445|nr:solute carrier organic anion transporter family member 4A1 [Rhipicephalus sanguineus]